MRLNSLILLLCTISFGACAAELPEAAPRENAANSTLTLPNEREATASIVKMMDLADTLAEMKVITTVKLGTCIPAIDAHHPGQVACTVSVKLGAGTSETQADFYRQGNEWVAQPSSSQDKLPFPDPAL